MFLPLVFLITLLSGCAADPNCKFEWTAATAAAVPQGLGVNISFPTDPQPGGRQMWISRGGFSLR